MRVLNIIRRRSRAQRVAEEIIQSLMDGIDLHGVRDFLDGTNEIEFAQAASAALEAYRARARRDATCWADILTVNYYQIMATNGEAQLRRELINLSAMTQEWIAAIDRRAEGRRWRSG